MHLITIFNKCESWLFFLLILVIIIEEIFFLILVKEKKNYIENNISNVLKKIGKGS
jgi:hypothetical protein